MQRLGDSPPDRFHKRLGLDDGSDLLSKIAQNEGRIVGVAEKPPIDPAPQLLGNTPDDEYTDHAKADDLDSLRPVADVDVGGEKRGAKYHREHQHDLENLDRIGGE